MIGRDEDFGKEQLTFLCCADPFFADTRVSRGRVTLEGLP